MDKDEIKKKMCPLMKDACKKEGCAWWLIQEAGIEKPDCAISKIGFAAIKYIHGSK